MLGNIFLFLLFIGILGIPLSASAFTTSYRLLVPFSPIVLPSSLLYLAVLHIKSFSTTWTSFFFPTTSDIFLKTFWWLLCQSKWTRWICSRRFGLETVYWQIINVFSLLVYRVAKQKSKNMMTEENLAIVFGPTLMRAPESDSLELLTDMKLQRLVVESLISCQDVLFESW